MTRGIILRPEALADIDGIWDYTASRWGMDQAEAYISDIRAALRLLATGPMMGNDYGFLEPELRKFNSGSHAIFYLHDESTIDVVRILHQRMDLTGRI